MPSSEPLIDASGVTALTDFLERCGRRGIAVFFSGMQPQPLGVLRQMGLEHHPVLRGMAPDFAAAIALAQPVVSGEA
ncbi:MAG TPA: sodium-independent anion transporter [Xanthomonadaceae bacterium]|nr:sodium-independent anion transporter [Xanthomonadaceae bacterium]